MPVSLSERYLFNPQLDYKHFMVPALMVMLLTILCGFCQPSILSVKKSVERWNNSM